MILFGIFLQPVYRNILHSYVQMYQINDKIILFLIQLYHQLVHTTTMYLKSNKLNV